jgi:drug/metabolite transporter (DMT)-like permease
MFIPILSKLASESLLSLYPIFVKKIGISMPLQLWTRLITYVAMASIFVDWKFVWSAIGSTDSIMLGIINMFHIFFSYEGFRNLDSGVSFAIFNTYPLMILLLAGVVWDNTYFLVLAGLALFIYSNFSEATNLTEGLTQGLPNGSPNGLTQGPTPNFTYGLAMILLAALTEAFIYFLIRRVKTSNHWNHVFISYLLGAVLMTAYVVYTEYMTPNHTASLEAADKTRVGIAVLANGFIGSFGYFLRFYSSYLLDAAVYAPLSYFGVVMSYVYGIFLNNETLSVSKVAGTACILASNYFAPKA